MIARGATLLVTSIALTVVVLRLTLHASPDSDFDLFGYNIHHLFTGLVLITIGGVPLTLFRHRSRLLDLATIVFGAGLGMALDEWVYLIATDGSNASYVLPVSLYGAILTVALACVYAVGVALIGSRGRRR